MSERRSENCDTEKEQLRLFHHYFSASLKSGLRDLQGTPEKGLNWVVMGLAFLNFSFESGVSFSDQSTENCNSGRVLCVLVCTW